MSELNKCVYDEKSKLNDKGCMFHPVLCINCKNDIGKYYVTTNKAMKKYLNKVCVFKDCLYVNYETKMKRISNEIYAIDKLKIKTKNCSEFYKRQHQSEARSYRERTARDPTISDVKDSSRLTTDRFRMANMKILNRAKSSLNCLNNYIFTDRKTPRERRSSSKRRYKLRSASRRTVSKGSKNELNNSFKIFIHNNGSQTFMNACLQK